MESIVSSFEVLAKKYDKVHLIVSPPRCGSTAFARVFWEHPSVRYYSHEPFETTYYADGSLEETYEKIDEPLDLLPIKSQQAEHPTGNSLVIKEMPYQIGSNFSMTLSWVAKPIIFLIRDPRLNIESRINKKLETGDSPFFPLKETGWELIHGQIKHCRMHHIPYLIVDSTDFRNHPEVVLPKVFKQLDLPYYDSQLSWKADQSIEIDNLGGAHEHLYKKVLGSNTIKPANEPIPAIESFTEEGGIRKHVLACMAIYKELSEDENLIKP